MIVVKLQGGLGNQMFQYAMGKAMAKLYHSPFQLDLDFLLDRSPNKSDHFVFREYDLDVFSVSSHIAPAGQERVFRTPSFWDKIKLGSRRKSIYKEAHFHYDTHVLKLKPDVYLDGYWQSPKYFREVEQELRREFTFVYPVEKMSLSLLDHILSVNSVCVNIRRGDFLNSGFHGVCDFSYFQKAMDYIEDRLDSPHFFVFSDDQEWCKENFQTNTSVTLVGEEHNGFKYSNKLQLMSLCKHFIIPNSTFAWWAVWLHNSMNNIIIAPEKWFSDPDINTKDLIPDHWIRL